MESNGAHKRDLLVVTAARMKPDYSSLMRAVFIAEISG